MSPKTNSFESDKVCALLKNTEQTIYILQYILIADINKKDDTAFDFLQKRFIKQFSCLQQQPREEKTKTRGIYRVRVLLTCLQIKILSTC